MFFRQVTALALYSLTGICCFLSETNGQISNHDKEQVSSKPVPSLCYIGQYRTLITPEQSRSFLMPAAGTITDLTTPGYLKKGTVFGKVNKEEIELEKEDLEVTLLKDKIARKEELAKMEREKKELRFLMSIPSDQKKWIQQNDKKVADKTILNALDEKIKLVTAEQIILEKKKRAELRKKEENYVFTMPFDGRLQYLFNLPDHKNQPNELYLDSSKEVAIVCDDSNFYMSILVSTPEIMQVDPHSFSLELTMGNGEKLTGVYSHKRLQKAPGGAGEMLAFFFKVPQENKDKAYEMQGLGMISKLYYRAENEVRMINKRDLAGNPAAKGSSSWQQLIDLLMPGHEVILAGETQIIIRKK